jgi:hypothetical protein
VTPVAGRRRHRRGLRGGEPSSRVRSVRDAGLHPRLRVTTASPMRTPDPHPSAGTPSMSSSSGGAR